MILKFTRVELLILSGAKAWRVWIESPANTSKELDKNVVVRV
jgi:hypothetical protein